MNIALIAVAVAAVSVAIYARSHCSSVLEKQKRDHERVMWQRDRVESDNQKHLDSMLAIATRFDVDHLGGDVFVFHVALSSALLSDMMSFGGYRVAEDVARAVNSQLRDLKPADVCRMALGVEDVESTD